MILRHSHECATPLPQVWAAVTDIERIGACFPGASVTDTGDGTFTGEVSVGIGRLRLRFVGEGRLEVVDEQAHRATIRSTGRLRPGLASAVLQADAEVSRVGERTRVDLTTRIDLRRMPLALAQPFAQSLSAPVVASFLTCLAGS